MDSSLRTKAFLLEVFDPLHRAFGPMNWWPAEEPFEVMVGAILTQNTSWGNVAKAIGRLKEKGLMDIARLHRIEEEALAQEIRSCGYYRLKARRLKHFLDFIMENYDGNLQRMFSEEIGPLRSKLLKLHGIGP